MPNWSARVMALLVLIAETVCFSAAADSTNSQTAKNQTLVGHTNEWGKAVGEAIEQTREQAEKGVHAAQFQLGFDYYVGQCVPTNNVEAVKWFRKAAEQGNPRAQNYLGYCYLKGDGVERNVAEGAKWYRKSAEQGDAESQLQMGLQYYHGRGVTKDFAEAMKWFAKAAEKDDPMAMSWIGLMHFNGEGVAMDYAQSFKWFSRGAGRGAVLSQCFLGLMLGTGRGVAEDYVEGYKWLNIALARGQSEWPNTNLFDEALKVRDALNLRMTPEQVAESQRRASVYAPHFTSESPVQPASAKLITDFAATARSHLINS